MDYRNESKMWLLTFQNVLFQSISNAANYKEYGNFIIYLKKLTLLMDFQARVEDLQRFKLASQIVCSIITSFGDTNLFPRESYEFYARITGRQLRVDENWTFSFTYPSS